MLFFFYWCLAFSILFKPLFCFSSHTTPQKFCIKNNEDIYLNDQNLVILKSLYSINSINYIQSTKSIAFTSSLTQQMLFNLQYSHSLKAMTWQLIRQMHTNQERDTFQSFKLSLQVFSSVSAVCPSDVCHVAFIFSLSVPVCQYEHVSSVSMCTYANVNLFRGVSLSKQILLKTWLI